ncbi:MAG: ATP-binding cassette domain-containing protein [Burkholderiaceae bacterium]
MIEAIRAHRRLNRRSASDKAEQALAPVSIASPGEQLRSYPLSALSGGMRQRVAIAIAPQRPDLIIADEPTTALDAIRAADPLQVQKLCAETGTALIWITHDLAVVAGLPRPYRGHVRADRPRPAPSMRCSMRRFIAAFEAPANGVSASRRRARLIQIPGMTPDLTEPARRCAFRPRCPRAQAICAQWPKAGEAPPTSFAAIFRICRHRQTAPGCHRDGSDPAPPMLSLRGVSKRFVKPLDVAGKLRQRAWAQCSRQIVHAVDSVNLDIGRRGGRPGW